MKERENMDTKKDSTMFSEKNSCITTGRIIIYPSRKNILSRIIIIKIRRRRRNRANHDRLVKKE